MLKYFPKDRLSTLLLWRFPLSKNGNRKWVSQVSDNSKLF